MTNKKTPLESVASRGVFLYHNDWRTYSKLIDVTADENDVIQQVFFLGGCNGNLQGVSQLVRGQRIDDVIKKLDGIRCGTKGTSCPDQLCRALEQLKKAPLS